jgi:hypothetical protein
MIEDRLPPHLVIAVAGLALAVVSTACAERAASPAGALGQYGAALEREDWAAAYRMMSSAYRRRVSVGEFRKQMLAAAADTRVAGRALRENAAAWASRAEVVLGDAERVGLVREGGAWRLESPPFEPFGQDTPRAALRAFIHAVEGGRYDMLVELAPARYRPDITSDKLRAFWQSQGAERKRLLMSALRLALERRIIEEGDEAYLVYDGGRQVRFIREEGLWRIESPE